jgi:uncharacterized protein YebE (UPF0316 family)
MKKWLLFFVLLLMQLKSYALGASVISDSATGICFVATTVILLFGLRLYRDRAARIIVYFSCFVIFMITGMLVEKPIYLTLLLIYLAGTCMLVYYKGNKAQD